MSRGCNVLVTRFGIDSSLVLNAVNGILASEQ